MSAGPEDEHTQPGTPGTRAVWPGSRRLGILAGVITAGILTGAGVAVAATSSSGHPAATTAATSPSPAPSPPVPPGGIWRHIHGRAPFVIGPLAGPSLAGGPFGAIHGTVVVPKSGGGYQTVAFQNGKVTAVSATSITLRSADGYSRSYGVTSSTMVNAQRDGIGSIKDGNTVSVQATLSGSTATAIRIVDVSLLQQGFKHFFTPAAPGA